MELLPTKIGQRTLDQAKPALEDSLRASLGADGFLSDLVECSLASVSHPAAITPFSAFAYKLYKSEAATSAIRALLTCSLPGTTDSFDTVLSAIASGGGSSSTDRHYCYLVGGQVRDVLRGVLSTDIDFNYSCAARDVALVTVEREIPTKYKCIGPVTVPNYVLIGDEGSDNYLEGFSISFNATKACCEMDFRQNMCLYDLANDVIIDKSGCGVDDIRSRTLRLSCSQGESYQAWASSTITQGFKELRYIDTHACVPGPQGAQLHTRTCMRMRTRASRNSATYAHMHAYMSVCTGTSSSCFEPKPRVSRWRRTRPSFSLLCTACEPRCGQTARRSAASGLGMPPYMRTCTLARMHAHAHPHVERWMHAGILWRHSLT